MIGRGEPTAIVHAPSGQLPEGMLKVIVSPPVPALTELIACRSDAQVEGRGEQVPAVSAVETTWNVTAVGAFGDSGCGSEGTAAA